MIEPQSTHGVGAEHEERERAPGLAELAQGLRLTLMRLDLLSRRRRDAFPLTQAQTSTLTTLSSQGKLRMSALAQLENVRVPTISNAISTMEDMGLVARVPDETDRRVVCVQITEAGSAAVEESLRARDLEMLGAVSRLSVEHQETLAASLVAVQALLGEIERGTPPRVR